MPRVVITMPAYRAEDTLAKTVADIPEGVADALILVDDASPDNTVDLARRLGIDVHVHPENRGYGGNQKTCYTRALEAGADIVVLLHPDFQYDPKAVPLLIAPILAGHADMTFGSRFAGLSDPLGGGMPLYRYVGNRVTTTLENLMLGSRFTELHSGLRAYTRGCLLSVPFLRYTDDFGFDSQFLVDAVTGGQRVVEVPIPTRYTKESSSISVLRSLKYVGHTLAYCARKTAVRGRRARRSAVMAAAPAAVEAPPAEPRVQRACALCGAPEQVLLYPATAAGDLSPAEFSCTSAMLSVHDDILQCPCCGMVSSSPTGEPRQIVEQYEGVVDETYLTEEEGRRELFDWVLDRMGGYALGGRRLLEVGSHVGLFLECARGSGWEPRGIEPSRWAVETGRKRFGVELREGSLEELDEPDASADTIVMLDVLEHLIDPLAALRRLRPVLADEGLLVLSTVNVTSLHARVRDGRWPWFIRPHLHYFAPETLNAFLQHAGFRMVEWTLVPRSFHLSYIANRARSNLGPVGDALAAVSRVLDVRVPVGWLGDVVLLIARPAGVRTDDESAGTAPPIGAKMLVGSAHPVAPAAAQPRS